MLYEKLDYVLAIAEEENLTRAAKKLYISQPTLTMYLNRLEESLGVKLFDRQRNPVTMTEAGKYYVKKMTEISTQEQILRSEIRSISNPADNFSIGIGRVRGHHWLPTLVHALTDKYPSLNIQCVQTSESDILQMINNGHLDMVIGSYPQSVTNATASTRPLCKQLFSTESLIIVAHKKYRLVTNEERKHMTPDQPVLIDPDKLNSLPFIVPAVSNAMYYNYKSLISSHGVTPGRTITLLNMSTGLAMAAEGLGVQVINSSILNTLDSKYSIDDLDFTVLDQTPMTRECHILWPKDSLKISYIQDAIQILREEVAANFPYNYLVAEEDLTIENLQQP